MTILVAVGGVSKGSLLKAEVAGQNECGLGGSLSPSLAVSIRSDPVITVVRCAWLHSLGIALLATEAKGVACF